MDGLKVSHKNPEEIIKLAMYLSKIHGDVKVQRGRIHEYLGMTLDYTTKGEVQVSMISYMKNIINEFPEEMTSSASMPAGYSLFQVQDKNNGAVILP